MKEKSEYFTLIRLTLIWGLIFFGACSSVVPVPEVMDSEPVTKQQALEAWSRVLDQFVDESGRVDFVRLKGSPANLKRMVLWIAKATGEFELKKGQEKGQEKGKKKQEQLSIAINAYNALAMYNIVVGEIPKSLSGLDQLKFFKYRKYNIGGRLISLNQWEKEILDGFGEVRAVFVINAMIRSSPVLLRLPFSGQNFQKELEIETRKFLENDKNVQILFEKRIVKFSPIIKKALPYLEKKSLNIIQFVNQFRTKKIPDKFQFQFNDYDWAVNTR